MSDGDARGTRTRQLSILRNAGRVARLGGWVVTMPDAQIEWSDETAEIFDEPAGFSPTREQALAYYRSEHRTLMLDAMAACIQHGTPMDVEVEATTRAGRRVWVRQIGEVARDAAGVIECVHGAAQDITTQRAQREEYVSLANRLLETMDNISDAFFTIDRQWRFSYMNRAAEQLLGRDRGDLVGRHIWTEYPDAAGTAFEHAYTRAMNDGAIVHFDQFYPPLDKHFDVDAHPTPEGVAVYFQDVTDRKRAEAQLLRAQRMESIGSLAGGIAHDLNNALTPILMTVSVLKQDERDPTRLEDLETIEACARRGSEMVRQVLAFARGKDGRRLHVSVGDVVADVKKIASDTFPKNIRITVTRAPMLPEVSADPTQLHQLFMNLAVNARDAMPQGGDLSFAVDLITVAGDSVLPTATPGDYVRVSVRDTGGGIEPAAQARIFEPFFTTKEVGKGTGLGLSTAHAIAKSHGGLIEVESTVGKGTCFEVYLPIQGAANTAAPMAGREPAAPSGHGELVLVVDDEAAIREVARRILTRFGYRTLLAENGAEALALYSIHRNEIAVVVTDMTMPVMDGRATIAALRALNPDVRVVASSGLDDDGGPDHGTQHFVSKPYTSSTLLAAVEAAVRNSTSDA